MKLITISQQLTIEQVIFARRFRDWEKYDKMSDVEKMLIQLEEFEIYEDILDSDYEIKLPDGDDGDDDEPDYFK